MALPLDPDTGMFPATLVEPFTDAPPLADLADLVMRQFDEFRSIADAVDEGLRIAYVWETKPFDPGKDEYKVHIVAKVTKASPLWRHVGETELVIQFRQWFWDKFDDAQRRAVIHHELTHILVDEPDAEGRIKVTLRDHDIEDFWQTMRRYGPVKPGAAGFVKAYLDWQHEQETPAPTPLRLAHELVDAVVADPDARARDHAVIDQNAADQVMDQVMDQVIDQVNAGALDDPKTGTKATASRVKAKRPSKADAERCPAPGCIRWADHAGDHDYGED